MKTIIIIMIIIIVIITIISIIIIININSVITTKKLAASYIHTYIPCLLISIFKHLQSTQVVLIHHYITDRIQVEIVHDTTAARAWSLDYIDEFTTQL